MGADAAQLVIELLEKIEAAHLEADELTATVAALREQRGILLQRCGELEKETRRQRERIAILCDENRVLRQQLAEWQKAAA